VGIDAMRSRYGLNLLRVLLRCKGPLCFVLVLLLENRAIGSDPLTVVLEAYRASSGGLESGIGKGTYRHYEGTSSSDIKLAEDADVEFSFSHRKYRVSLSYNKSASGAASRATVFDGEVLATSTDSKIFVPAGQETQLEHPTDFGGLIKPRPQVFPWDVSKLSSNAIDVEGTIKNFPGDQIKLVQRPSGDIDGTILVKPAAFVRLEFARRFGFNLVKQQVFASQDGPLVQDYELKWERSKDGLWYVTAIQDAFVSTSAGHEYARKDEMELTSFEPNAEVDAKLFTLASLSMKAGSLIVDRRNDE
jgi:hypothetical protein